MFILRFRTKCHFIKSSSSNKWFPLHSSSKCDVIHRMRTSKFLPGCDVMETPYKSIQCWISLIFVNFFPNSQDDHKAFRRQLEDKRSIVESNLLSGKQYVASEPPFSDTSDTEGKKMLKKNLSKINLSYHSQLWTMIHVIHQPMNKVVN